MILERLFWLIAVLFIVISITFLLIRIAPGGPFSRERKIPENIEQQLLARYKLDGTLSEQYTQYISDVLRGDLGLSTKYRNWTVNEIISQSLPISAVLGGTAFLIASLGGIFLGTTAAVKRGTWVDTSAMFAALAAISIPAFVTAPLLILIFGLWLNWLPVGGWGSFSQLLLPALCLAAPYVAYIARLTRGSMLEVLQSDFIRTAHAKGLAPNTVIYKHALKVAILPVVSFLGPLAAHLLTGSIVVETIFNIPGTGGFFVRSIENRDAFLLGGVVILYCTLLVVLNFMVDIVYTLLDKRISLA